MPPFMRILIAEDDERLAGVIARGLRKQSYAVDIIADGARALLEATLVPYDALVLDVMLPGLGGHDVARELRTRGNTVPILMLTARDAVADRVQGLDAGADDYMVKPFAFDELLARIRALLRRGDVLTSTVITVGDLVVDTRRMTVSRAGTLIALTGKEYALLEYFARNPGRVISREDITTHVWDDNHDPFSNSLEVYVGRLRKKINTGQGSPMIRTRRGLGYVLVGDADDAHPDDTSAQSG